MKYIGLKNLSNGKNRLVFVLFILSLFYSISIFIAPLTLEPGTVTELQGTPNQIEYAERWEELPLYHRAVYSFGDLNCHQMHSRSYYVNGNQMPIAGRMTGIFIGFTVGFFLMSFASGSENYKRTLLDLLKVDPEWSNGKEMALLFSLGALFMLPMILDGGLQFVIDYDSFNEFRTLTGILFGFGFSVFISSIFLSS